MVGRVVLLGVAVDAVAVVVESVILLGIGGELVVIVDGVFVLDVVGGMMVVLEVVVGTAVELVVALEEVLKWIVVELGEVEPITVGIVELP